MGGWAWPYTEGRGRVWAIGTQTKGQGRGAAGEEGKKSHTRSRVPQYQKKIITFEDK